METTVLFKVEQHVFQLRQNIKSIALYNTSEHTPKTCSVFFVESGAPLPPPHTSVDDQGHIIDGAMFFQSEFIPLFLDMLRNEIMWVFLSKNSEENGISTQNWQGMGET